ncbi:unnamed protein product [Peniophora sp. CBMAI 1063]|nr:unnamed protein product [Peniophora sp. CBMAI 1063]
MPRQHKHQRDGVSDDCDSLPSLETVSESNHEFCGCTEAAYTKNDGKDKDQECTSPDLEARLRHLAGEFDMAERRAHRLEQWRLNSCEGLQRSSRGGTIDKADESAKIMSDKTNAAPLMSRKMDTICDEHHSTSIFGPVGMPLRYDVSCSWGRNASTSYALRIVGTGAADGEGSQRHWVGANGAHPGLREMGPGTMYDTVEDICGDWSWRGVCAMDGPSSPKGNVAAKL